MNNSTAVPVEAGDEASIWEVEVSEQDTTNLISKLPPIIERLERVATENKESLDLIDDHLVNRSGIIKDLKDLVESLKGGATKVNGEVHHHACQLIEFVEEPGGSYIKFLQEEIPYLIKSGAVNKEALDHVYPVIYQVCVATAISGHSGSSIGSHVGLIKKVCYLAQGEVQQRQLPFSNSAAITWAELEAIELKAIGCEVSDYAFTLAFKAKEYKEFTYTQLQLMLDILKNCLNFKPLTPLTLEDDEWVDVGLYFGENTTMLQNRRCSSVFKTLRDDGSVFVYNLDDGVRFNDNDNPQSDMWFTRGGRDNQVEFNPNLPLGSNRIAVFLKWDKDQEPGTTPDGDWTKYNYIPTLPEIPQVGTYLRRFNFEIRKVIGHQFVEGELTGIKVVNESEELAQGERYVPETISVVDYFATGQFREFKYPHYSVYDPKWYMKDEVSE